MLKIFTNFNAVFLFLFFVFLFWICFACKWSKKNVVCLFDLLSVFFLFVFVYKLI